MSRTTLILIAFVLATGCGDSGNPVGPSPTPVLAVPRLVDPRPPWSSRRRRRRRRLTCALSILGSSTAFGSSSSSIIVID